MFWELHFLSKKIHENIKRIKDINSNKSKKPIIVTFTGVSDIDNENQTENQTKIDNVKDVKAISNLIVLYVILIILIVPLWVWNVIILFSYWEELSTVVKVIGVISIVFSPLLIVSLICINVSINRIKCQNDSANKL